MTIRVVCECGSKYRVAKKHAGKTTKCKACDSALQIPALEEELDELEELEAVEDLPAEASGPAPAARPAVRSEPADDKWFVFSHDETEYGPVSRAELDQWVAEGLITAQCQLLREGDEQWHAATSTYPQLAGAGVDPAVAPAVSPVATAPASATANSPAANSEPLLTPTGKSKSMGNMALRGELKKLSGVQMISSDMYHVGEPRSMIERLNRGTIVGPIKVSEVSIDGLQLFHFRDASGEFAMILPFDNGMIMPIEYVSVMPGCLPAPIVLLKQSGGKVAMEAGAVIGGPLGSLLERVGTKVDSVWAGCDGSVPPVAEAAQQQPNLSEGVRWEGKVGGGPVSTIHRLGWGVQALPLSSSHFLLVAQSVPKQKMIGFDFGVTWFCNYRSQFAQFVASLNQTSAGEFNFFDPGVWLPACAERLGWVQW